MGKILPGGGQNLRARRRRRRRAPLPATTTKQTYFLSFTAPYANAAIVGVNTISLIATG